MSLSKNIKLKIDGLLVEIKLKRQINSMTYRLSHRLGVVERKTENYIWKFLLRKIQIRSLFIRIFNCFNYEWLRIWLFIKYFGFSVLALFKSMNKSNKKHNEYNYFKKLYISNLVCLCCLLLQLEHKHNFIIFFASDSSSP